MLFLLVVFCVADGLEKHLLVLLIHVPNQQLVQFVFSDEDGFFFFLLLDLGMHLGGSTQREDKKKRHEGKERGANGRRVHGFNVSDWFLGKDTNRAEDTGRRNKDAFSRKNVV